MDLCGAGFTGDPFPYERIAVRTSFAGVAIAEIAGDCSVRFTSVLDIPYYVHVSYGNDQGNFTFRMRNLTPPSNDNFAARTVIGPGLPITLNGTNSDSTYEAGEPPSLGGSSSSRSVWYTWTAPSTGRVRLDMCESTKIVGPQNRTVVVYTGPSIGTLVPVISGTSNCEVDFLATAGVPYQIAFSGSIVGEMDFVLKLKAAPPPTNDNFVNATTVGPGLPVSLAGDNDFATAEAGEPEHTDIGPAQHSVWYNWTPAANARVRISACSRTYSSSKVGVYVGNAVNALVQVAELPGFAPHCRVVLNVAAGATYRIAAAGGFQDGAHGPFTLDIHVENLPTNDNFANAQDVGSKLPATIPGTSVDATVEQGEPGTDSYGGSRNPSVWYEWTAPSDDAMIFSACSTGQPVVLAVFSGAVLADLDFIDGAKKGCAAGTEGGRLAIAPVKGETYSIVVESTERNFDSSFTLSAIGPKVVTPVVPAAFNLKKAIAKCKKIKSKKQRARCIRAAKKKAAIIKCKKLKGKAAQNKCIKAANRKFR